MTEVLNLTITNDSFLNLLDELRDELEMISTTNALTTNVDGDDDIENAVTKCQAIVDTIAADFMNKQNFNTSGFTHISKALPVNTLNNDVLYIGINRDGFACVFNYLSSINVEHHRTIYHTCHYIMGDEKQQQMNGLVWWKVLELPTFKDFYDEGGQAFNNNIAANKNPYPVNSHENYQWNLGWEWNSSKELPF